MTMTARREQVRMYYTVRELAEARHCSPQHVRDQIERGEVQAERDGRNYRIPAREYIRLTGVTGGHEAVHSTASEQIRREELRELRLLALDLARRIAALEG